VLSLALGLALVLAGCRTSPSGPDAPQGPPWFEDVSDEVGLDFVHDAGPQDGKYFTPQQMGSGCALFDFDGDGLLDVLLLNNGGPKGRPNKLYRQTREGRFIDVSAGSGLDFAGWCMGVAVGDVNNDGLPDVLVTEYGHIRLLLNKGGGKFEDVTAAAGLANPGWATSAAFFDYDRDGWLDLVVVNYVDYDPSFPCHAASGVRDFCPPRPFRGTVSRLFRNKGATNGGPVRFEDVSFETGIGRLAGPGLGVVCADFDGDGWPDVFVANDGKPNHLWMNKQGKTFMEQAVARGLAYNALGQAEAGMGVALGDVDGDGLFDLFVTHLRSETNTVWRQSPRGLFRDRTGESGMARPAWRSTGFGTMLGDFDHDGALDAVITNGLVAKQKAPPDCELGAFWGQYADRNQVFRNDGRGAFEDLSPRNKGHNAFCGRDVVGRGLAIGDVRNSGALWVLVSGVAGRARLYKNVVPDRGHWLVVRVFDPRLKRDALGAEVTVRAGQRSWVRLASAAGSYLSSNDPRAHFGLGKADSFDSVEVRWPDGLVESFAGGAADRHVQLERGQGRTLK
jgi:hypothetical protein